MRIRPGLIAVAALCGATAVAAAPAPVKPSTPYLRVADQTTGDGATTPKTDNASPGTPPATSGPLEVQPGPQPPAQPPSLNLPSPPVAPSPNTEGNPPPNETLEQHQEPPPRGQAPDELPRGEGAAMIPKETPSAIKAIEEWVWSWF